MRKYIALVIGLILVLTGCSNNNAEQTETTIPVETVPEGYYEKNSAIEAQTNGAVRKYALPGAQIKWFDMVDDRLLLAADSEPMQLHMLSGEAAVPVAVSELTQPIDRCQSLFNGFAYYNASQHTVIYADPQLKQTQSISLPADAENPVISQDGNQIFYCVGNEIRATDVSRKLSRLVKNLSVEKPLLIGSCFEGKILICSIQNSDGTTDTLYISTENGQTLKTENNLLSLCTYEDRYFAERMDGIVCQRIVGTLSGEVSRLNVDDPELTGVLELGGVMGYSTDETGSLMNFYDLSTGKRSASVVLPGVAQPKAFLADRWSGCIWILANDSTGSETVLLRWNIKASAVQDDRVYTGTLYTAENPDTASMETINSRVSALNKKYGVRIRIWNEAVKSPGNHTLVAEHQILAISDTLDKLEPVLAEFPKSFISKSISSKVRICLVRSIDGETKGIQYWSGSNAFIALSTGVDVRSEFLQAFGYVIDSHVLGNSPKYDYWDALNPSGFMYGTVADESLITGENRAFVDLQSMTSGTADRAHVFWQAMLADNADMFKGETMQKKLTMLCKAIRDAWNLEKSKDVYPWEQYLTKPIAYKKK